MSKDNQPEESERIRMAELSKRTGVSVATIKFYIRDGLVPPGQTTVANQAWYTQSHIERIRLIRGLSTVAKMSLASIAELLRVIDSKVNPLEAMRHTQHVLLGEIADTSGVRAELVAQLDEAIVKQGWNIHTDSPAYQLALSAMAELDSEHLGEVVDKLGDYIAAADVVGATDVATLAGSVDSNDVVRGVAMGTVLRRPLMDALILLAQQHHAKANYEK